MQVSLVIIVIVFVFVLIAIRNMYAGIQNMREARHHGQQVLWYKQHNILFTLSCILIALVFLIDASIRSINSQNFLGGLIIEIIIAGMALLLAFRSVLLLRAKRRDEVL